MAFESRIRGKLIRFCKLKSELDVQYSLSFVRRVSEAGATVVLLDIRCSNYLVRLVTILLQEGYEVFVADHHDFPGEPCAPSERELAPASEQLRDLLGERARIATRSQCPCCLQLINVPGEFRSATIIADEDADGLTAALYAVGISYGDLLQDAIILDGPTEGKLEASTNGLLLLRTLAIGRRDWWTREVFYLWPKAVQGYRSARSKLEARVFKWQKMAETAKRLALSAQEVTPGVLFVDAQTLEYDLYTLAKIFYEQGCLLFVVRQKSGPVAKGINAINYRIDALHRGQATVNVREFLPPDYYDSAIRAQGTFRIWASEERYQNLIWPAVQAKLA